MAGREASMMLLWGLFHLKNFSKYKRKIDILKCSIQHALPSLGSSFTKGTKFILGQRGSFTIRNQSTAEKEHVRTSVVNSLKFKADPLETF